MRDYLFLTCQCGSADSLAQGLQQEAGITNWMALPIHKGKEHCRTIVERFPEQFHTLLSYRALVSYLSPDAEKPVSTFVIIVGYDDTTFYWEDFASNAPDSRIRALAILERYK